VYVTGDVQHGTETLHKLTSRIKLLALTYQQTTVKSNFAKNHVKLEMCGKAQCDSSILVLLAPSSEYD